MRQLEGAEVIYYDDEEDEFFVAGNCSIVFSGKTIKTIDETFDGEVYMVSVDDWYINHHSSLEPTDFTIMKDGKLIELK